MAGIEPKVLIAEPVYFIPDLFSSSISRAPSPVAEDWSRLAVGDVLSPPDVEKLGASNRFYLLVNSPRTASLGTENMASGHKIRNFKLGV